MDHRARILGIAALSGPSNLSRSQWTSRTALPTGFKRIRPTAEGKYRSALFDRCTRLLVSRTSPTSRTRNGVYSEGIRLSFQYNDQYSLLLYYKIVFLPCNCRQFSLTIIQKQTSRLLFQRYCAGTARRIIVSMMRTIWMSTKQLHIIQLKF